MELRSSILITPCISSLLKNAKYVACCRSFIEIGRLENNTKSLDCSSIIIVLRKKT